jgi:hypothetical protein
VHGWLYRWRTRVSDAAVENTLERILERMRGKRP